MHVVSIECSLDYVTIELTSRGPLVARHGVTVICGRFGQRQDKSSFKHRAQYRSNTGTEKRVSEALGSYVFARLLRSPRRRCLPARDWV